MELEFDVRLSIDLDDADKLWLQASCPNFDTRTGDQATSAQVAEFVKMTIDDTVAHLRKMRDLSD